MVQRYRGHTIVSKPDANEARHGVVVFEGNSDEAIGEFDSPEEARAALDRRAESAAGPKAS
jgi:hypothetical protein